MGGLFGEAIQDPRARRDLAQAMNFEPLITTGNIITLFVILSSIIAWWVKIESHQKAQTDKITAISNSLAQAAMRNENNIDRIGTTLLSISTQMAAVAATLKSIDGRVTRSENRLDGISNTQ